MGMPSPPPPPLALFRCRLSGRSRTEAVSAMTTKCVYELFVACSHCPSAGLRMYSFTAWQRTGEISSHTPSSFFIRILRDRIMVSSLGSLVQVRLLRYQWQERYSRRVNKNGLLHLPGVSC